MSQTKIFLIIIWSLSVCNYALKRYSDYRLELAGFDIVYLEKETNRLRLDNIKKEKEIATKTSYKYAGEVATQEGFTKTEYLRFD